MSFDQVSRWLDDQAERMVDLQAGLTAIPALNPEAGGAGEWAKSLFLENWLKDAGLGPAEHYDTPDDRLAEGSRPNFVVRLPGEDSDRRTWVMTHLDVVPPGERKPDGTWKGWDSDPFELRREGDRIYGRGVEDNQQALVAGTFAALALKEMEMTPPREVALLYVSAEETGSAYGLHALLAEHPELFSPDDVILVPDGGNEDGTMVEVAEKSVLWLNFHMQGQQAHGSMPQYAVNTSRGAARVICELDSRLHERFDAREALYRPPYSSFEPTRHQGNVPNVNTIPGEESFSFDCRILPRYDLDDVMDEILAVVRGIDEELDTRTEVSVENHLQAPEPTSTEAPVVKLVEEAIRDVYEVEGEPMGIGGSTVAACFRQAGYPAVVWSRSLGTAHRVNECCVVPNMVGDARVFAHVFLNEG